METENTAPKGAKGARAPKDGKTISAVASLKAADDKRVSVGAEVKAAAAAEHKAVVVLTTSRLVDARTRKPAPRGSIAVVPADKVERLVASSHAREASDREIARAVEAKLEPITLLEV